MISILIFIFANFASASSESFQTCPYPLPSRIEPCTCKVDAHYRMFLTCVFPRPFTSEDLGTVLSEFDYNNNIYHFEISSNNYYGLNKEFSGQLDRNNVGRLNITNFKMEKLILNVNGSLIQDGAFEGSLGSIKTIHIYNEITRKNISMNIDLDNVLAHSGPTLESVKLSYARNLRSSSFWFTPRLSKIVFVDPGFDHIPANTFSGKYLPNLSSFEMNKFSGHMTIQADAFTNLVNLTSLKMTKLQDIQTIETSAFNNLPIVTTIDFSRTTISGIEEDSFANFSSLESFDLNSVLGTNVTYLPRLLSNSPLLTTINIDYSDLQNIAKDFFVGTPNIETISFIENKKLEKIVVQDLNKLTFISLSERHPKTPMSIELRNLSKLESFRNEYLSKGISSASFSDMQNLKEIYISNNTLETISIDSTPNLQLIDLGFNNLLNHTGLTTSLHGLLHPNINIKLRNTNVRTLAEQTFRPLIERLNENSKSTGKIEMNEVNLDCGCDVKWLVVDIGRHDFFTRTKCPRWMRLDEVDPLLLKTMCPPEY